ncbi:MAG: hypothetical protein KF883_02890 [Thermomicrobiales bacterium]|nr:hypothetical protein [Thermomicrobiales bacterium]
MADDWTCGKGLAAHASVPAAIGQVLSTMATLFDRHTLALDPAQPEGRAEYAAYASLAAQHRMIAAALASLSAEMAGYETLPMAEHNMDVMMSGNLDAAFRGVVDAERELLAALQSTVDEHGAMLTAE